MKFYALALLHLRGVVPAQLRLLYLADGESLTYQPDEDELRRFERTLDAIWEAILLAGAHRRLPAQPEPDVRVVQPQGAVPGLGRHSAALPGLAADRDAGRRAAATGSTAGADAGRSHRLTIDPGCRRVPMTRRLGALLPARSTAPTASAFHATFSTTGPWFADAQHVGPPSALLVRAVERCAPRPGTAARPVHRRGARAGPGRRGPGDAPRSSARAGPSSWWPPRWWPAAGPCCGPGRGGSPPATPPRSQVGAAAAAARAGRPWRARAPDDGRAGCPGSSTPSSGAGCAAGSPSPGRARPGAGSGCRWWRARSPARCSAWRWSPTRATASAAPLDLREWLFVNTDLTLHLHRAPVGEWMARRRRHRGRARPAPARWPGCCSTSDGQVGRSAQAWSSGRAEAAPESVAPAEMSRAQVDAARRRGRGRSLAGAA